MKFTSTPKAPAAIGPYSQAVSVNGLLFTSGQVAFDPATGEIVGTTIQEQAEQVCKNLGAILEESGLKFENVVLRHSTKFTESILQENPLVHVLR